MTERTCSNHSHAIRAATVVGTAKCPECGRILYGRPKEKCSHCFNYMPGCTCPPPADPMDDLYKVGPKKPLGYLPLKTIRSCGFKPGEVASDLESRKLQTRFCTQEESKIVGGALYAWDHDALEAILANHRSTLESCGWGMTPDEFTQDAITRGVCRDSNPQLYALVGQAFSDRRFKTA